MVAFAIGDVQGCHCSLERLIAKIGFDPAKDQLWFCGDLVNRGPDSLKTLRFVRNLGDRAVCVLGNHDLHLLAVDAGLAKTRSKDTLDEILSAPDRDELIDWLRHRPLAVYDFGFLMVHAGVPPQWDREQTLARAAELEAVLRSDAYRDFLRKMYGDKPARWKDRLKGKKRLRCIVNCFTRLRYCKANGKMCHDSKGAPGSQPNGLMPWYEVPGRASAGEKILFGHWSTLGEVNEPGIYPLDTGCVWGGKLSARRLDDPATLISLNCEASQPVSPD